MADSRFDIPSDRLPEGFAESIEDLPTEPVVPRAAATIVLIRPSERGPEVLLLRRNRTVGFVPGAYVFPGGRVDALDAATDASEHLSGLTPQHAAARLGITQGDPPALAYYVAALREAFEETGLLVGFDHSGEPVPDAAINETVRQAQIDLTLGRRTFAEVLDGLGASLDGRALEYIAHWITPVVEPRRYDTRFFAAAVGAGARARPDGGEITEATWLTPTKALSENQEGLLPMIFPTIKTLQGLEGFPSVRDLLDFFDGRAVPAILPRLVRTSTGVGIEVAEEIDPSSNAAKRSST